MLEMDDPSELYETGQSHLSPKIPHSPYSVNYDNEEFYPETEDEHQNSNSNRYAEEHALEDEEEEVYDQDPNQMDPEDQIEQERLEKTIFHKAMIGIGPYLVEKAASVLEASRSYSGDLAYLPSRPPHGDTRNATRGGVNKPIGKTTIANSRSQSMTKGFQKLRIASSFNNKARAIPSRGGATSHFRFQRGYGARKVNNKSSSTSSIGRKPPAKYPENSVNQRLLSARRGMIKELKCRISELETHLRDVQKENQLLQRLQHRHEVALSKYEGAEAELPRLIRSHVNEVKSLQENLRKAQSQNRNIDEKMKSRDQKIFRLEEENRALVALVKQNDLEERSKLAEQLELSRKDQAIAEGRVADLQRHVEILEKNHRFQISVEKKKLRTANNKLFEAHEEMDKLYAALKEKDRIITCIRMRQGQGQIPLIGKGENRMQIFADDASLRSARTLPAKKPPPHYPKDHMSLHEEQLRRQRSETLGPTNQKSGQRQNYGRNYGAHEETSYARRRVSRDVINPRPNFCETPHQPVSPPSGGHSEHSKIVSEIQNDYESPLHSRSSMSIGQSRIESASVQVADTDRTDRTIVSENIDDAVQEQDDEYYNFENVSVEEDNNYHPHRSLYVDALDSSCNVSSGQGQSPMDSMRSHFNRSLRPSSAGPKFRLETVKSQASRPESISYHPEEIVRTPPKPEDNPSFDRNEVAPVLYKAGASPNQNIGGGDAPEVQDPRSSRPISYEDPCDFVSQRSSSVNSAASKLSKPPTATSESEDDSSCEVSGRSGELPQLKSFSEIQVSSRCKSDANSTVIQSIFNKWKHSFNRQSSFDAGQDASKDETTPRRKELLIQKLKEIDANRKKVEDIVPLTNPAYFPIESDPAPSTGAAQSTNEAAKPAAPFRSAYQPFFSNSTETTSECVKVEGISSGRKLKAGVPWLSSTPAKSEGTEILKDKNILKSQHSSILEPRLSLPPTVSNSLESGKLKETVEAPEDQPRKKFSIGTISSSQGAGLPASGNKKPTSSKSKPGRGGWK